MIWHSAKKAEEIGISFSLPFVSPAGHGLATLGLVSCQETNRNHLPMQDPPRQRRASVPGQSRLCATQSGAVDFPYSRPFNPLTDGPLIRALITVCKGESLLGLEWKKEWYFILSCLTMPRMSESVQQAVPSLRDSALRNKNLLLHASE